ncbi:MAG: CAP domain-containing protein [Pyrinomonadaceae bacterium]
MLELVNRERAAAGLRPVVADPELTEMARRHSTDMFQRGYFSLYARGQRPVLAHSRGRRTLPDGGRESRAGAARS